MQCVAIFYICLRSNLRGCRGTFRGVLEPGRRVEEQRQKRDRKKERKKRGTGCRRGRNREMKNVV